MTAVFAHLGVGFLLSFLGSLPPGLINLSVAETTVHRGKRPAAYLSLGAALVEGIQVLIAIKFASWFIQYPQVESFIQWASIPIFLGLGVYHLWKNNRPQKVIAKPTKSRDFFRGVLLSSLNFLAIPFWLFYGSWLGTKGWLAGDVLIGIFSVGAFTGTVVLLFVYGWLSLQIVNRLEQAERLTNQILAVVFMVLGLWQLWRMI